MDWDKVVESLKKQADWNTIEANKYAEMHGYHELTRAYRMKSDIAMMLASALHAGAIR